MEQEFNTEAEKELLAVMILQAVSDLKFKTEGENNAAMWLFNDDYPARITLEQCCEWLDLDINKVREGVMNMLDNHRRLRSG